MDSPNTNFKIRKTGTLNSATVSGRFLRTLKRGGVLFPVFPGFSDAGEAARLGVTASMTQVRSNGPRLAESDAASFVTGVALPVDGGLTLP